MSQKYRAAIFDLDGVIVDTAKYHYLAWRNLAKYLGFDFTERDNERLKGVSRKRSLEILLELGNITMDEITKNSLTEKKNREYIELIKKIGHSDILPGAKDCLLSLKMKKVKIALGSASKNAPLILNKLGLANLFDAIIDGNRVSKAKPDPEIFLLGAQELGVEPEKCVVFEDSEAGLQAALAARMYAIGVGDPMILNSANEVVPDLTAFQVSKLF